LLDNAIYETIKDTNTSDEFFLCIVYIADYPQIWKKTTVLKYIIRIAQTADKRRAAARELLNMCGAAFAMIRHE
jgi:hypothetical protein